jgi:hypothetical protein
MLTINIEDKKRIIEKSKLFYIKWIRGEMTTSQFCDILSVDKAFKEEELKSSN